MVVKLIGGVRLGQLLFSQINSMKNLDFIGFIVFVLVSVVSFSDFLLSGTSFYQPNLLSMDFTFIVFFFCDNWKLCNLSFYYV